MIEVLTGLRPGESHLLEDNFRLRHKVFVEELKWRDLARPDGREIDKFDGPQAVYLLNIVGKDIGGSQRLLPTTLPHLLSDVHAHLCGRSYERAPHIWEWTRMCINPKYRGGKFEGRVAIELIVGGVEWGLMNGVHDIVLEFSPSWISRFSGWGFKVRPLGLAQHIEGEQVIAVQISYNEATLSDLRKTKGITKSLLSFAEQERSVLGIPGRLRA
jgi:acyl-homoserine lactone synthase